MRTWRAGVFAFVLLGCVNDTGLGGRWQGASEPGSDMPVTVAFTLRAVGDSLRGWGVARTDGRSFPITARGKTIRDSVALVLAPWRWGVIDMESAQLYGSLHKHGEIVGTVTTAGNTGEGPVTQIKLTRPAH
jgi:hypothetical protein